jgi:hypothetical protein
MSFALGLCFLVLLNPQVCVLCFELFEWVERVGL